MNKFIKLFLFFILFIFNSINIIQAKELPKLLILDFTVSDIENQKAINDAELIKKYLVLKLKEVKDLDKYSSYKILNKNDFEEDDMEYFYDDIFSDRILMILDNLIQNNIAGIINGRIDIVNNEKYLVSFKYYNINKKEEFTLSEIVNNDSNLYLDISILINRMVEQIIKGNQLSIIPILLVFPLSLLNLIWLFYTYKF